MATELVIVKANSYFPQLVFQNRRWGVMPESWEEQLRKRFPDWLTPEACLRFLEVSVSDDRPYVGDIVSGVVISRAPFGVWVDIDCGFLSLLLVVNMLEAEAKPISFDEYPELGTIIYAEIHSLGVEGEIGLSQIPNPKSVNYK